jgi:tripartite-type tricarboxylate transporter receptor subunit TctC
MKKFFSLFMAIVGLTLIPIVTLAARPFYEGKTIRFIVGLAPGGGQDIYARFFARHMGKHIPGHPNIFVENMPGAGSLTSANYLYNVAKPDGLTICTFNGALVLNQTMGRPGVKFDARKFKYIGVPMASYNVFVLSKLTGIRSANEWMSSKVPFRMGASMLGTQGTNGVRILKEVLGFPIQLVLGYDGYGPVRLAVLSEELHGCCVQWSSAKATWRNELENGDVRVLIQCGIKPEPDLPKIPLIGDFAKTDEARKLIHVGFQAPSAIQYFFVLPPGTPEKQVQILRQAFQGTLKDKEFIAEAQKANLQIGPISGEEVKSVVDGMFNADPKILVKLNEILYRE